MHVNQLPDQRYLDLAMSQTPIYPVPCSTGLSQGHAAQHRYYYYYYCYRLLVVVVVRISRSTSGVVVGVQAHLKTTLPSTVRHRLMVVVVIVVVVRSIS